MEYFKGIKKALYKGKDSKDAFSFKHYNASEIIGNKTMERMDAVCNELVAYFGFGQ